jgi:N-acetylneuraminic acid mutarotase
MKYIINLVFIGFSISALSQWEMQKVADLPKKISNSAVVGFQDLIDSYAYTFAGIDSTKLYSGIHLSSFKYSFLSNSWSTLPDLPDTLGKIAASASIVKNKIYIIGGYHVRANGSEISSNKVHVFNPQSNVFETDAANCPYGIDDQVQAVWRDSLIFVVTGWSNTGNVATVRSFNPTSNTWQSATAVPNTTVFKAFGATATIINDTIFYYGGASTLTNFPSNNKLRKGVINPNDATQITWTDITNANAPTNYRGVGFEADGKALWYGGSNLSYNYDGIPYTGAAQAFPNASIANFGSTLTQTLVSYGRMDFRGIAKLGFNQWLLVGGMDSMKNVTNGAILLRNPSLGLQQVDLIKEFNVSEFSDHWTIEPVGEAIHLYTLQGQLIKTFEKNTAIILSKDELEIGLYLLKSNRITKKIVR